MGRSLGFPEGSVGSVKWGERSGCALFQHRVKNENECCTVRLTARAVLDANGTVVERVAVDSGSRLGRDGQLHGRAGGTPTALFDHRVGTVALRVRRLAVRGALRRRRPRLLRDPVRRRGHVQCWAVHRL